MLFSNKPCVADIASVGLCRTEIVAQHDSVKCNILSEAIYADIFDHSVLLFPSASEISTYISIHKKYSAFSRECFLTGRWDQARNFASHHNILAKIPKGLKKIEVEGIDYIPNQKDILQLPGSNLFYVMTAQDSFEICAPAHDIGSTIVLR